MMKTQMTMMLHPSRARKLGIYRSGNYSAVNETNSLWPRRCSIAKNMTDVLLLYFHHCSHSNHLIVNRNCHRHR